MPLNDGEIFAGFRIVRLLGSGGMGEVNLVQHQKDPVARAFAACFRGYSEGELQQPANTSGIVVHEDKRYLVLRNANGILAHYRIRPNGALRGLKRWPAAIEEDFA